MKMMKIALIVACTFSPIALADIVVPVDEVEIYVNIRSAPRSNSDLIGRLQQGTSLQHVGTSNGWYEVRLDDGSSGFISSDWSRVVAEEMTGDGDDATARVAREEIAIEPDLLETKPDDVAVEPSEAGDQGTVDAVTAAGEALLSAALDSVEESVDEVPPAITAMDTVVDAAESLTEEELSVDESAAAGVADEMRPEVEVVSEEHAQTKSEDVAVAPMVVGDGSVGVAGPPGPAGPEGPAGPSGAAGFKGKKDFIVKFDKPTVAGDSQIYDNGRQIGIGTTEPKQRLEVDGNIQIHDRSSNVAGLMITQSSGETGYIMHNRAGTLTIGAGSIDRLTIDGDGNVGIGVARPEHPLEMASGAHVTKGGVWTNSSSFVNKDNIESLTLEEALVALLELEPVQFNYKNDPEERYVGFIAEDVPGLVASGDRKGLSTMDIVAVLTRVVQAQQIRIDELERHLEGQ